MPADRRIRMGILVLVVLLLTPLVLRGAASAADEPLEPDSLCALGQAGVIYGTEGNDRLNGTAAADRICGLGGADEIDGRGGNDILLGGPGADSLKGGDGNDQLYGEDGNDVLEGGNGNDGLFGAAGDDTLGGGDGSDGLAGGDGNDEIVAGGGNDVAGGDEGNDRLSGQSGNDVLDGGGDTDSLSGADGVDICINGETTSGCEQGAAAVDSLGTPLPVGPARSAAPNTFTIDDSFPGIRLTVQTDGGIWPWDVKIKPARSHMSGRVEQVLAGPAFDISVPAGAPPIRGATLTLPYSEVRVGAFPEGDLRIYTFDEDAQLWVPAPGLQTVDAAANTVTASLTHFSVYAVLKVNTSDGWREVFGNTPIRCVSSDSGVGIDVVFLVDTSGSMSSNDPTGFRVDGAKAFVDGMRAGDRASVVGFDSFATRELGLTGLDSQAGIDSVKSALERTRNASGGTDISDAVAEAITILSANGGGGRLRVAVLLTDGQSPYNTALTTQSAANAIEIHTVGLGAGVSESLLRGIAEGTGATYRFLADPAQLPALYEDLAGDIIDDGTDTDGDGLTDCVERNGLFVPLRITFPFIDGSLDFAAFITTDPAKPDTDGDTILDGAEVEARDLRADPALAAEYDFLVDAGLTTYYKLIANPSEADSDGDGLRDDLELRNGTDPLVPDGNELGIEGLDLPPFTLFQPDRYDERPAITRRLELVSTGPNTAEIRSVFYNSNPVVYEGDRDCVENCVAIQALAAERPNDNGFGICIFGLGKCVTDESQARDIVEEARQIQGVFNEDGFLRKEFLQEQVALQCAAWFSDLNKCRDEAAKIDFRSDLAVDDFAEALAFGTTIAVPGQVPNAETLRRIAEALRKTAAVAAAGIGAAALTDALVECFAGPALQQLGQLLPFFHPCEIQPMYAPGRDVGEALGHRVDALLGNPLFVKETWASQPERTARPFARNWYIGEPGCTEADKQAAAARFAPLPVSCDEFPNWAMEKAGPPAKSPANPQGTSLRYIPAADNGLEGNRLNTFFQACPGVTRAVRAQREVFLVVPVPISPITVFHCGR